MRIDKERISYIDIAKGLGMLLVIWGHIRETGISNAMVYAFHMPLFFFLSGMTYCARKYDSVLKLIRRRLHTLIIPYAIFSVFTWLVWFAYNHILGNTVESYWMPLLQTVISQGSGGYLVHNSPLWFVTCLFCVELIYYFTSKLPLQWNTVLCIVMAVAGNLMIRPDSPVRYLPWSLDMALCALPFYLAGNIVSEKAGIENVSGLINRKKLLFSALVIAFLVLLYFGARYNGPVSMGHRKLNMPYVFYPLAFVGIAMHLSLSVLLSNLHNVIIAGVRWFGNYSFNVMAVQTPIKGVILVVLGKLLHRSVAELSNSTGYSLIAFVITLIAVTIVVMIINRLTEWAKERRQNRERKQNT